MLVRKAGVVAVWKVKTLKIRVFYSTLDGVIADSEVLANTGHAGGRGHAGSVCRRPSTTRSRDIWGKRAAEVLALIESGVGRPLPTRFAEDCEGDDARSLPSWSSGSGRRDRVHFAGFSALPRCIASSSSVERLQVCLEALGITDDFSGLVFSADMVEQGKPHPDLFLYAASRLQVEPARLLRRRRQRVWSAGGNRSGHDGHRSLCWLTPPKRPCKSPLPRRRHAGGEHAGGGRRAGRAAHLGCRARDARGR